VSLSPVSSKNSFGKGLRIGLSPCFFHADPTRPIFKGKTLQYVEQSMARWVQSSGALTYLIPSPPSGNNSESGFDSEFLSEYVSDLHGLVLQGGSDLSPTSYGEVPLRPEWSGDRVRDEVEIALVREFCRQGKPILGVCRGLQLLNVAFGGTLYQDIALQRPDARNHRNAEIYDRNHHWIEVVSQEQDPRSRLGDIYGAIDGVLRAKTNTIHHQAVKTLGRGCIVEARCVEDGGGSSGNAPSGGEASREGIIEAFRVEGERSWILAVQWHPEFHAVQAHPSELDGSLLSAEPLLRTFLNEARKFKSSSNQE
jgi:putative glutamine amidotransferase